MKIKKTTENTEKNTIELFSVGAEITEECVFVLLNQKISILSVSSVVAF
jgi:hypothetical protein